MTYTEDFLKKVVQMGTLGYPLSKILNVLDVTDSDAAQFTKDFYNSASPIAISYKKGCDKGDFMIDSKLFEFASKGDLDALEKYEQRKEAQLFAAESERRQNLHAARNSKPEPPKAPKPKKPQSRSPRSKPPK